MSLFETLGHKQAEQITPETAMRQLRDNPTATLKQAGYSIPDGMTDPSQIIQHLMQSGQINTPKMQMTQRMMSLLTKR